MVRHAGVRHDEIYAHVTIAATSQDGGVTIPWYYHDDIPQQLPCQEGEIWYTPDERLGKVRKRKGKRKGKEKAILGRQVRWAVYFQ